MGTDQQQFCLRWHSYQSSLMATLPQLLDGNHHLTDVTLSAQGRNLRAHKVILSACSLYFKELFKELQPLQHPVIVLPGMNFADLVALVTFMYSGEVNIYQHQLSGLLTMADVLHIRGLSEVGSEAGNAGMDSLAPPSVSNKRDQKSPTAAKRKLPSSPTHVTSPPLEQTTDKKSKESALDYALYGKRPWSQPLDPNLYTNGTMSQEVAENLATLDSKLNASQFSNLNEKMSDLYNQKIGSKKSLNVQNSSRNFLDDQVFSAVGQKSSSSPIAGLHLAADGFLRVKTEQELVGSAPASDALKIGSGNGKHALDKDLDDRKGLESSPSRLFTESMMVEDKIDLSPTQGLDLSQAVGNNGNSNNSPSSKSTNASSTGSSSTGHTKLYATCFVCGKQLSNQYNLRVHMETHQNVQYACSICSHVSRSKDALRKHVSYRHPTPVDGSGSSGGSSSGGNKREGRKKAEQTAAAAAINVSSTSAVATTAVSTVTTMANSTTASSSVTTTSTNPVTSSDGV
ncbi:Protein bric-a-brac 2 [Frankliniella fusca]|uniref:Protein bric-a-brac 2 n=1 Tax=Frankliniella fusca TaxID=407009 RepID=A0AAE1GSU4_9NEOP|nr:Protein bric-a-brac 2 [Frankliniella fusca]